MKMSALCIIILIVQCQFSYAQSKASLSKIHIDTLIGSGIYHFRHPKAQMEDLLSLVQAPPNVLSPEEQMALIQTNKKTAIGLKKNISVRITKNIVTIGDYYFYRSKLESVNENSIARALNSVFSKYKKQREFAVKVLDLLSEIIKNENLEHFTATIDIVDAVMSIESD
jgi:hypothetical protein